MLNFDEFFLCLGKLDPQFRDMFHLPSFLSSSNIEIGLYKKQFTLSFLEKLLLAIDLLTKGLQVLSDFHIVFKFFLNFLDLYALLHKGFL